MTKLEFFEDKNNPDGSKKKIDSSKDFTIGEKFTSFDSKIKVTCKFWSIDEENKLKGNFSSGENDLKKYFKENLNLDEDGGTFKWNKDKNFVKVLNGRVA